MYTGRTNARDAKRPAVHRSSEEGTAGTPLMIPRDYHGEMLRAAAGDAPESTGTELPSAAVALSAEEEALPVGVAPHVPAAPAHSEHRLLDGVFDLLLGNNSDEEETVLLLGVAVLLLSGHMERRNGENRWSEDDLALLLIGYLLLG